MSKDFKTPGEKLKTNPMNQKHLPQKYSKPGNVNNEVPQWIICWKRTPYIMTLLEWPYKIALYTGYSPC